MAAFSSSMSRSLLAATILAAGWLVPAHAQGPTQDPPTQDPWNGINNVETQSIEVHDLPPLADEGAPAGTSSAPQADASEPDWSQLDNDNSAIAKGVLREQRSTLIVGKQTPSWNEQSSNGTSAVSVKRPITPFWDTRIGADMTIARAPAADSAQDAYRNQFGDGTQTGPSSGSAWAAMTAPGVGSIWDQTSIEARIDPGADQTKFGTSLSKSVPLAGNQYSLTLQSGYNVIQQGGIPMIGYNGRPTRSYETDQSARFDIAETGTSFMAGQSLATTDDRWLHTIGAEQKIFGGVNISGSLSETASGITNKSLTAGFRHSW